MRLKLFGALALISLLLAACAPLPEALATRPAATQVEPAAEATTAPATAEAAPATGVAQSPLPAPTVATSTTPEGEVSATGIVYTTAGGGTAPFPNIGVRLARVIWNEDKSDGAFVLEGGTSPSATTDAQGAFAFRGVPAGDYVIVVGDPYAKHEIISQPDGKATIYTVVDEGPTDWGEIVVSLAP